jgi:hypothetical protein
MHHHVTTLLYLSWDGKLDVMETISESGNADSSDICSDRQLQCSDPHSKFGKEYPAGNEQPRVS